MKIFAWIVLILKIYLIFIFPNYKKDYSEIIFDLELFAMLPILGRVLGWW